MHSGPVSPKTRARNIQPGHLSRHALLVHNTEGHIIWVRTASHIHVPNKPHWRKEGCYSCSPSEAVGLEDGPGNLFWPGDTDIAVSEEEPYSSVFPAPVQHCSNLACASMSIFDSDRGSLGRAEQTLHTLLPAPLTPGSLPLRS